MTATHDFACVCIKLTKISVRQEQILFSEQTNRASALLKAPDLSVCYQKERQPPCLLLSGRRCQMRSQGSTFPTKQNASRKGTLAPCRTQLVNLPLNAEQRESDRSLPAEKIRRFRSLSPSQDGKRKPSQAGIAPIYCSRAKKKTCCSAQKSALVHAAFKDKCV